MEKNHIDDKQFEVLDLKLGAIDGAINRLADRISADPDRTLVQAIDDHSRNVGKWLAEIANAIAGQAAPQSKMRGTIMASYQIPDDQPDAGFTLTKSASDAEGNVITDPAELAKLSVEVLNSDETVFAATLNADGSGGTYHVGAPGQATVTQNLKDGDGNIIATGTDGFTVTTGKVAIGSVSATFEGLTPIPSA